MSGPYFHRPNLHKAARRWRCYRCEPPFGRSFDRVEPICPHCHAAPPAVVLLVDVHFLAPDGPIPGYLGSGLPMEGFEGSGGFWHVACQPQRRTLGTDPASNHSPAVTCFACKQTREWQDAMSKLVAPNDTKADCCS